MIMQSAAIGALGSAIREASKRCNRRHRFGVAVIPSGKEEYFDVFLAKVPSPEGDAEFQKQFQNVSEELVPVRIQELLMGTHVREDEVSVFLRWQAGKKRAGWLSVNKNLQPVDIEGTPIVAADVSN